MRMSAQEHRENAEEFISMSQGLTNTETIDRDELTEQLSHTDADADDVEAIAQKIEDICKINL